MNIKRKNIAMAAVLLITFIISLYFWNWVFSYPPQDTPDKAAGYKKNSSAKEDMIQNKKMWEKKLQEKKMELEESKMELEKSKIELEKLRKQKEEQERLKKESIHTYI